MSLVRRTRGAVLRLAWNRPPALVAGALLMVPPLALVIGDYAWESWVSDGVGLVCGATGLALLVTALSGRRPDWVEPDQPGVQGVQRVQSVQMVPEGTGLQPSEPRAPSEPSEPA